MLIAFHIDKIDNVMPPQISESKLAGYGFCAASRIWFEYSLFQMRPPTCRRYSHPRGHRFGLVKYQITARF